MDNNNDKDFRTRELERRKAIKVNENVDQNKGRVRSALDSASSSTKGTDKSSRVKDFVKKGETKPIDRFSKSTPESSPKSPTTKGAGGGGRIQSQQKFIKGGKVLPRLDFDLLSEKEDKGLSNDSKTEIAKEDFDSNDNQIELLGDNNNDNILTANELHEINSINFETLNNDSAQNPAEELELASLDINTDLHSESLSQNSITLDIEFEEPSTSLEENDEIGSFYWETENYNPDGPDMDMDGGDGGGDD